MTKKCAVATLIFLFLLYPSFQPAPANLPHQDEGITNEIPLSIELSRDKKSPLKSSYLFKNITRNILWNNRKINLSLKGSFQQKEKVTILEIKSGNISIGGLEPENFSLYALYKDRILTITYLKTQEFVLNGKIHFTDPVPSVNLILDIKGTNLERLNKSYGLNIFPFQGDFRGKISITGKINNPFIKGSLEAYQGKLKNIDFTKVFLNFEGFYPMLRLFNSYAKARNYRFALEGRLNLDDLASFSYNPTDSNTEEVALLQSYDKIRLNEKFKEDGFLAFSENSIPVYKMGEGSFLKFINRDPEMQTFNPNFEF